MTAAIRETRFQEDPERSPFSVEVGRAVSPSDRLAALEIRRRVFAVEQHVSDLRVADPDDAHSVIALAWLVTRGANGVERRPVSTGRLTLPRARDAPAMVAWVATVPEARGRGAGGAVMRYLLDVADTAGIPEVVLAAQVPAEAFYRRLGFIQAGPIYDVRGIPHRRMVRYRPD